MTGGKELKVDERWNEVLESVNSYLNSLGYDKIQYNAEVEDILNLNRQQLLSLSKEECCANAFLLNHYALILQKEYNEHNTKYNWANHNLKILFGKLCHKYGSQYTSYDERQAMVLGDNIYAVQLNKMIEKSKVRINQLESISMKVATLSKMLADLQYSKDK